MEYVPAKHLLHRSRSTEWFGTDHTVNIYRGCCHGCLYCDSRSDCYQIGEFDTVRAKADALRILRDDLERAFPGQGLKERYLRQYGDRYQCASPRARTLWRVFTEACRERGVLYDMKSIIRAATLGYGDRQLTFFD